MNNNEKQNKNGSLPKTLPLLTSAVLLRKDLQNLPASLPSLWAKVRELSQSRIKMWIFVLWSTLWNNITVSLRLTVLYEWEKGRESGFYYSGINLNFSSIESSSVQSSSEMYFFYFFHSVPVSPFTTYTGTTHRIEDTVNLIAIWIEFRVK